MLKLHRMKSPRKSHTHLQFARADTQPKIAKEYVLPTLTKMLTKFKETEGMKKAQPITKAIRNLGKVLILKLIVSNKISSKLEINSFKIPNYA